jgi:hypothetical protein
MNGQFLYRAWTVARGYIEEFRSHAAVREAFSGIPIDTGWFNTGVTCPAVVRWGDGRLGEWTVAFIPPALHRLEITNDGSGEPFALEHPTVPLPGMVIFGMEFQYHIWAVKTERLEPYHEIYHCPLPNVYPDGAVCWGLLKPKKATAKTILDAFDLFIKSTFNNHFANGRSKTHRDDVRVMLRELAGQDRFPAKEALIRQVPVTGVTLDTAIREFFKTGNMPK